MFSHFFLLFLVSIGSYYMLVWLICSSFLFVAFLCLCVFFGLVSAPLWPLSWLLSWLSLCTLGDNVVLHSLTLSSTSRPLNPVPSVQIPLKHRLSLQAINNQLLCLLVLQFSPSPSPLQVLFICPVSSPHLNADSSPAARL